ncbi:SEC14-like protein 2 isoform X2 [Folsomia candida]|nr:SEC14-like protein 2 isoform X2 [Folsomia candida]
MPQDYMKSEIYLVKWLRTSNFHIGAAEERLFQHLEWRKDRGIDDEKYELDRKSEPLDDDIRFYLDGRDKLGRPFMLLETRNHDARRLIIQGKYDKLVRFYEHAFESGCKLVLDFTEKYKNVTRGHLLVNLDGLIIQQNSCVACVTMFVQNIINFVQNYPECIDKIIVANAPLSFNVFANIGKAAFSEEIRRNVQVYGKNTQLLRKSLSTDFERDQIPPSLGGSKIYAGMEDENVDRK